MFQVLSDGKVVEFDRADVLLSKESSYFSSLVMQTGPAEAEYLRTLANSRNNFNKTSTCPTTSEFEEETKENINETDPLLS